MIVRAPSDPALAAEGWEVIESDSDGELAPEFWWMHPPSRRTVKVEEASARLTVVDDANRHHNSGWFVFVREHDELGNPIAGETVGPIQTMTHAMRFARAIRRSILEDRKVDLRTPEQLDLLSMLEGYLDAIRAECTLTSRSRSMLPDAPPPSSARRGASSVGESRKADT